MIATTGRYVLSLRKTGLGDRLICLCAAWTFARNTGRSLVVDWRHSLYSPSAENLFPLCFEPTPFLAGVRLIAGETLDTAVLPRPIHPRAWDREELIEAPWRAPADSFPEEREKAVALIWSGEDVAAPTVVFNSCINDAIVSFEDARSCLQALRPVKKIAEAVNAYHDAYLSKGPWIGLHVRHGNGGDIMMHASSWLSFHNAIDRCRRAVELARSRIGSEAMVFLCTDSIDVEREVVAAIPGVICRPKQHRRSGEGELHHGKDAADRRDDALIEMLLLAKSSVLIRYPAGSFFSFYAAVMKPTVNPHPASVRDLMAMSDPNDTLSPAILF